MGTAVQYKCTCSDCDHIYHWDSQPYSARLALGNLVVAAAAFFAACSPTKLLNTLKNAGVACFGMSTYFEIQASYLLPAVRNVWTQCQVRLFEVRQDKAVKLAGDGRCDSPGHCAKYGSYTLMDAGTSEILHVKVVQVRPIISGSNNISMK